jgi:two-component system, OmpR family, KDP operon response regulator KdpE
VLCATACDDRCMANRIALIIDDEPQIRRVVANALADDFETIIEASNGAEGLKLNAAERPSLVVLDLALPDLSGAAVCAEIRKSSDALILVLSARNADHEKASLLDAGADDYVTKPFSTLELKARVHAMQRRLNTSRPADATTIENGALRMDLDARTLSMNGRELRLTPTEWDLVRVLMLNAGKTMTHRQLFSAVWTGRRFGDAQQYLRVHIANVRRKIEVNPLDPAYIITEPGVGYRFSAAAGS